MPTIDLNSSLEINSDLPIALFPIRLETRFNEKNELLVRIYPDTAQVDSFEPELTEAEIVAGKNFWIYNWLAGDNEAQKRSAWAQLAQHFGVARAAWIAKALAPTNSENQPKKPIPFRDNKLAPESLLPVMPIFRKPGTHSNAWTRAPYTRIMPSKWIALIYEKDDSEPFIYDQGNPIASPLNVGISPKTNNSLDANTLGDDKDIGWLVNFEKAKEMGMGLCIPYSPQKPIKRLIVLGVNTTLNAGDKEEGELQKLIEAHHYTQGISFLTQGALTNNVDSDIPSDYSTLDPGFEASYLVERNPPSKLEKGSNGVVTANALGIDHTFFNSVKAANESEQSDAEVMNATLWSATWGYFLEHMMAGPNSLSDQQLGLVRTHFEQYVRARGPIPAIRIGNQPYGILPTISLEHWKPIKGDTAIDQSLAGFLHKLRAPWKEALAAVPNVPGGSGSFDELQTILNLSPISVGHQWRASQRIALHSSSDNTKAHDSGNQTSLGKANDFGLSWIPRQIRMVYNLQPSAPPQPEEESASGQDQTTQNFFEILATETFGHILNLQIGADSLFFLLLRESCLREYFMAASRILKLAPEERLESEYEDADVSSLWKDIMQRPSPSSGFPKISDYLDSIKQQLREHEFDITKLAGISTNELITFAAFFKNLNELNKRSDDQLDILFRETLDLCSHRYDAWVTSMASKRLEMKRSEKPKGIYFGGYGWVEDFKQTTTPEPETSGFIHAPSLAHATTAALLRSGYLSRTNPKDRKALAINLSSERVRTALWLLDGVRQGQSLSALLGYRFERSLHESDSSLILDQYISVFRRIASLEIKSYTEDIVEAQSINQVVDGLALLQRWQSESDSSEPNLSTPIPWGKYGLPGINSDQHKACVEALKKLEDAVDAIADLVIAESVHQIAQGNPVRAGAALSAIAEGEAPPPELDVIRTPRTGTAITHRIAIILTGLPKELSWGPQTPRARAEPLLNAWIAQLLGPRIPKAVCTVEYYNSDNLIISGPIAVTLDQLGLAPIDLLYLPESEGDVQRSELEQRVIYWIQQSPSITASLAAEIKLNFAPELSSLDATLNFAEVLEIVRVIRKLITSSRALSPRDLVEPGQSVPREAEEDLVRTGESADTPLALGERASLALKNFKLTYKKLFIDFQEDKTADDIDFDTVRKRLKVLVDKINTLTENDSEQIVNCNAIRANLMELSFYSLADTIPIAPIGETLKIQKLLLSQLQSVLDIVEKRNNRIKVLTDSQPKDNSPTILRDFYVAQMNEIFGQEFRVLPRFNPANAKALHKTFLASDALQTNDPLKSVTWFQRIARVREGAARLDAGLMYSEAIGGSKLEFKVGQLPYKENEQWVALEGDIPGSRISLVVQAPVGLDFSNSIAGLLIDEWVEVVPSKDEITGLAFHFDSPQSRPPQAILLAVHPNNEPVWNLKMLADTLLETMELAKLRSVDLSRLIHPKQDHAISSTSYKFDPSALTKIGQFLPALYFPEARAPK